MTGRRQVLKGLAAVALVPGTAGRAIGQAIPTRTVHTAAELEAAFRDAPDGGRLLLAPGRYGAARLAHRRFPRGLTVTSADPARRAVLERNLRLHDLDNVTLRGVDFRTGGFFEHRGRWDKIQLGITACRNMVISDLAFTGHIPTVEEGVDPELPDLERHFALAGYGRDKPMQLTGCDNVLVEGVRMADIRIGLGCNTSRRIRLQGLEIARAREGINFRDTRDLTISDCHFHSFRPWLAEASPKRDHPDMIQYWASAEEIGIHRIEIRDCLFHQAPGQSWTQTVFGHLHNLPDNASTATNLLVTGNTIINSHVLGIALHDARDVVVADNVLLPTADQPDVPRQIKAPGISLHGSRNVDVMRNSFLPFSGAARPVRTKGTEVLADGTVRVAPDNRLLSTRPSHPDFWRKLSQDVPSPAARYRAQRGWAS